MIRGGAPARGRRFRLHGRGRGGRRDQSTGGVGAARAGGHGEGEDDGEGQDRTKALGPGMGMLHGCLPLMVGFIRRRAVAGRRRRSGRADAGVGWCLRSGRVGSDGRRGARRMGIGIVRMWEARGRVSAVSGPAGPGATGPGPRRRVPVSPGGGRRRYWPRSRARRGRRCLPTRPWRCRPRSRV